VTLRFYSTRGAEFILGRRAGASATRKAASVFCTPHQLVSAVPHGLRKRFVFGLKV
jgi:hypothetical protein